MTVYQCIARNYLMNLARYDVPTYLQQSIKHVLSNSSSKVVMREKFEQGWHPLINACMNVYYECILVLCEIDKDYKNKTISEFNYIY